MKRANEDSALYSAHPELQERVPLLRVSSDAGESTSPQVNAGGNWYCTHPWVNKAIGVVAKNLSPHPIRVVEGAGGSTKPLENHEVSQLLANPNPEISHAELWMQWAIDMQTYGEEGLQAVWSKSGSRILELWPRKPQFTTIRPVSARWKQVAFYHVDDGEGTPMDLTPDKFIFSPFYNPISPWRGLAPLAALRMSILLDVYAQAWTHYFLRTRRAPISRSLRPMA